MLTRIALWAIHSPKRVLGAALIFLVAAGIFGAPVSSKLTSGGFQDPSSDSFKAAEILRDHFDAGGLNIVFEVIAPQGADSPAAKARALEVIDALEASPYAQQIASYWTVPPAAAAPLKSNDGRIGLVVAEIEGTDAEAPERGFAIAENIPEEKDGVVVKAGGGAMIYSTINETTKKDLAIAEAISIPLTLIVLVWVFGSIIAASLPLAIGLFAIIGTTAVLRVMTMFTDVSIFAMNLTTVLGLALAIDYALFIVSRYREERANGLEPEDAMVRTVNTAGRTVLYSALTVALSLAAMAVFPMYFLRSFAYAGLAVVGLSAVAAIVVAPALITVLGHRVEKNRRSKQGNAAATDPEASFWYRTAQRVMRHALPVGAAVTVLFLLLGAPFLGANYGYPDDRVLPDSKSARQVGDDLRTQFPLNSAGAVTIVLPGREPATPQRISTYAAALSRVAAVPSVHAPDGTYVNGSRARAPAGPTGAKDGLAYLTVNTTLDPFSDAGKEQLEALKDVPIPGPVMFTGPAQWNIDNVKGITERMPLVLGLIALSTFVVLFMFTGSLLLPLKALVMNTLSLSATFGAMVWIFQDGNLGAFGATATGYLIVNMPVLMFCIAFGMSMDYEVFLLSRIREEWQKSGKTAADNERAVALGLARTGRIVTAAAVLMAIVFAGTITANVSFMKMFGLGMTIAVLMDATLIRGVLVPAFMRMAGRANWWAPAPLARWHERHGFSEDSSEPPAPKELETQRA